MKPYRDKIETERYTLYLGDALDILPTLEAGSVVTDPPYGMDNDCDYTRFTMGPNGHGKASSRKYQSVVGDDKPFDPAPWLGFSEVILWGQNHFAERLPVGTALVWIKRFDGGFGSFLSDAELGWMKGGCGVYCHRDTSLFGMTHQRSHPTEKPVGLMEWCISKTKGETILDPYLGSGTTLVAAMKLGRRGIGIEIDEGYFKIAAKRIAQAAEVPMLYEIAAKAEQGKLFDDPR